MKKYAAELILLFLQLLVYYTCPLFAGPTDTMGMVFLMLLATLCLSFALGLISKAWYRFLWPFVTAAVFIPSVWIWYNSSALIHAVWYMFSYLLLMRYWNSEWKVCLMRKNKGLYNYDT